MLTFVTVNYNSSHVIKNLLTSLVDVTQNHSNKFEFIIYDNFYSDEERIKVKELEVDFAFVKVVNGNENVGFAKGNNIAASLSIYDYLFFINPDCLFNEEAINEAFDLASESVNSPFFFPIVDEDNNGVKYCFRFPFLSHYLMRNPWRWFTGANLLISKELFNSIGGWPEDYFMYSEDTDLHYILNLNNKKIKLAKSKISHIGNASVSTVWNTLERERRVFNSMLTFAKKYNKRIDFLSYYIFVSLSFLIKKPSYTVLRLKAMYGEIKL
ncbi:glycosyltransferase family 2 protein [Enterobacter cloacae]|uniref:glycosyltransferase family 2 protein n=1 Tax=Enterobacter cloacae TaxID=550 RepID=UPI0024E00C4B|nr:glycosyltransferase [Enterobacter cloacae]MDK2708414.1 glycosyltransferase [Enterobacter cloacae]